MAAACHCFSVSVRQQRHHACIRKHQPWPRPIAPQMSWSIRSRILSQRTGLPDRAISIHRPGVSASRAKSWEARVAVLPGTEHRVVVVTKFEEAIYVLHAFDKKTPKTAQEDIDLARQRYKEMVAERRSI